MKRCILFFLLLCSLGIKAQEIEPKGYFLSDTMDLAEPVQYSFSVKYPKDLKIVFPDSTYNYFPFEFRSKRFFTTYTDSTVSIDSAVYTLASFELEKFQSLALPAFILNGKDSLKILSKRDTIVFQERVEEALDSLKAIENANYVMVEQEFNYPYFIIGLVVIVLVLLLAALFFGKGLMKKWKVYRLQKLQDKFSLDFKKLIQESENSEKMFSIWKKHCEKLSKLPLSKMTVKEIDAVFFDDKLSEDLQKINRKIYSSSYQEDISNSFNYLLDHSWVIYQNRVKEIQND